MRCESVATQGAVPYRTVPCGAATERNGSGGIRFSQWHQWR